MAWATVEMSSSGRNDLRMNAKAPAWSAAIAVATVAKPVTRTISPISEAARSARIRSTPLASGSLTSTTATSNPSRRAALSPACPVAASATSTSSSRAPSSTSRRFCARLSLSSMIRIRELTPAPGRPLWNRSKVSFLRSENNCPVY